MKIKSPFSKGLFLYLSFMKIEELHQLFIKFPIVCTDTRKISKNSIFFALKGDNFNGNTYASEAIRKGAKYSIVDEEQFATNGNIILVDNVLKTLQDLAKHHREYCNAKVIGLTGSNGKTTTKELIYAVLSKNYRTVATKGNLNNHIGVPLTLLSIKEDTEIAIVEMGANHQKEIAFLCNLAQPDYGYITNFGKAHLEGFGGEEGVIKGKSELYDYLIANNKPIFLNADDPIQKEKLRNYPHKYGFSKADHEYYNIHFLGADPFVRLKVENTVIDSKLIGKYNFTNCSAVVLIGKYFNVPIENSKEAIEDYIPENNRSQLLSKNGHHIILDAYNANPSSMKAALENFKSMKGKNKLLFLGDMFELGASAADEHQRIVDYVSELNFQDVIIIGANFNNTKCDFLKFKSFTNLEESFDQLKLKNNFILIKGSRGMALERILNLL